ncbi:hypothetical protein I4U23_011628 [Adineta vaga]|nr:hypothetical protein I4U23_011628 [Adineta vaga]
MISKLDENDPLRTNTIHGKSRDLTEEQSIESDLHRRVKNAIKTLTIKFQDESDEAAHFGFLEFKNYNENYQNIDSNDENDRFPLFIHLAPSTRPLAIGKYLEACQLPAPDFILSIRTSAINENDLHKQKSGIKTETERAIQSGLTAMAKITNPWITTDCKNDDMMKLIGNALHKDICGHDIPCLGFSNWNSSLGDDLLIEQFTRVSINNEIRSFLDNEYSSIHTYIMRTNTLSNRSYIHRKLQPNHTHFILFNDQSIDRTNILYKRQEIEHELSINRILKSPILNYPSKIPLPDHDIPIIMLSIGGDFSTLAMIGKGLAAGTPVVVVRNTGGIADIIAQLCRKLSPNDELGQFRKRTYIGECKIELKKLCLENDEIIDPDEEIEKYVNILNEMDELVIIFDAIEHTKLEDSIADAMLKGIKYREENWEHFFTPDTRRADLIWSMVWNKSDYAQKLLVDRNDENTTSTDNNNQIIPLMQQLLFEALYRNNASFVSLLMQYGASIDDLTDEQLIIICVKTMNDDALILTKSKIDLSLFNYENKIHELKKYLEEKYNNYLREYIDHYVTKDYLNEDKTHRNFLSLSKIFDGRKTEALYLWFIFMNKPAIAKYLCSRSRNQIVASLLAVEIYSSAEKIVRKNKRCLENTAEEFDQHSRMIIDKCLSTDKDFALKLLECKASTFYNCFPLDIAQRANCRIFLASDTIQKHLEIMWYHRFNYQQRLLNISATFWIKFAALLFPLIPILPILCPSLFKNSLNNSKTKSNSSNPYEATVVYKVATPKDGLSNRWSISNNLKRIKWFYQAPVIRFYNNLVFFVAFLFVFSYILLVGYFPFNVDMEYHYRYFNLPISFTELILHICMWSLIIDELYQFISQLLMNYNYSTNSWNWMDQAGILFYLLAFGTRWSEQRIFFIWSKIFMSISCTKDAMMIFVCFILIILFGFSVSSWALLTTNSQILWPNASDNTSLQIPRIIVDSSELWNWQLLRDLFNWGIWKVFGQVAEPYNDSVSENDISGTFVFFFAIGFTVISNVLLLNVLIALFNEKITRVQEKSNDLWRNQRFWLIYEMKDKTVLPPPFNILCYLGQFFMYLCSMCRNLFGSRRHHRTNNKSERLQSVIVSDTDTTSLLVNKHIPPLPNLTPSKQVNILTNSMDHQITDREKVIAESYWQQILTTLKLSNNEITSDGIVYLANALKKNQAIKELTLGHNQISDQGAHKLADFLQYNTTLTELGMTGNPITIDAARYLSQTLRNKLNLRTLNLSRVNTGFEGVKYLADYLRNNTTLVEFDLSRNRIGLDGTEGIEYLTEALCNNKSIRILRLATNKFCPEGVECFVQLLENNTTLIELDLSYNWVGDDGLKYLSSVLENNQTLTSLGLIQNELEDDGIDYLLSVLENNNTLNTLLLQNNYISDIGAQQIAKVFQNNKTLIKLGLYGNLIKDEGAQYLADAFRDNTTLITLSLKGNEIGEEKMQYLKKTFENDMRTTPISLEDTEITGQDKQQEQLDTSLSNTALMTFNLKDEEKGMERAQYLADIFENNKVRHILCFLHEFVSPI